MSEFDFNSGGEGEAGAGQAEDSAPELAEIALGPEKSTAGRNTAMILMAFAAVGAATIYFMRLKSGPGSAGAATPQVEKEAKKANETVKQFIMNGGKSREELLQILNSTTKLVEQFKIHERLVQVKIATNPFLLKEPEKLDEEAEKKKKEEEAARIAKIARDKALKDALIDVQKLKLSFIMGGAKGRTCMINGVAYKPGGVIQGFTIRQIDPDKVIVAKELPDGAEFTHDLKAGK